MSVIDPREWEALVKVAKHYGIYTERCSKERFEVFIQTRQTKGKSARELTIKELADLAVKYFTKVFHERANREP